MNVSEYLKARGWSIYKLCNETGIAYTTLRPHVNKRVPLSDRTARKLQEWSGGAMNAAEILGLKGPDPVAERKITSKKRRAPPSSPKTSGSRGRRAA